MRNRGKSLDVILISVPITTVIITILLLCFRLSQIIVSIVPSPSYYTWNNLDKNTLEVKVTYIRQVYEYTAEYVFYHYQVSHYACSHWDNIQINWDYGVLQIKYDNGQSANEKSLNLFLDGNVVYQLGGRNWGSTDFIDICNISKGSHEVGLFIAGLGSVAPSVTIRVIEKKILTVHADEHSATCYKDSDTATHVFKFTIPQISEYPNKIEWTAKWGSASSSGWENPSMMGKQKTLSFNSDNFDYWRFKDSVVVRVGGPPPGVEPTYAGWHIDAYYCEDSSSVGLKEVAVAISDGNNVGYRSAKYLVTDIKLHDLQATGHTGRNYWDRGENTFDIWANVGSEVQWKFIVTYYAFKGNNSQWCYDSTPLRRFGRNSCGVESFSDTYITTVQFYSKGKMSSLELTITCNLKIHFDALKAIPIDAYVMTHRGRINLSLRKTSEREAYVEANKKHTLYLGIKTVDVLGEVPQVDYTYYSVTSNGSGRVTYTYSPSGNYKGITAVEGLACVTVRWVWFRLSYVVYGASRLSGDEYWVDCAKSGATVEVYVQFEDTGEYAKGVSVFDCCGNTIITDSTGKATFSYWKSDKKIYYYYYVNEYSYYDDYDCWSDAKSVTIVYTRILLTVTVENAVFFNGKYFALNGTNVKLKVNAKYSHDGSRVSGASVYFFNLSRTTDSGGNVEFILCSSDEEISSKVYASKWVISGQTDNLAIVFTGVSLIPFRANEPCYEIEDSPGASSNITLKAYLTYNKGFANGLDVKWVQGNAIRKTPASFMLNMPLSPTTATFELINFLPCKPVNVRLIPKTVELSLSSVENAVLRNGKYWNRSHSVIRVKLKASYLYCNSPIAGIVIKDSEGNSAIVDSNGFAEFSYSYSDREFSPVYTAYDDRGYALGKLQGPTLVFSRISLNTSANNAFYFKGIYYAANGANVTIFIKAFYSHSGEPASNATITLFGSSSKADESGIVSFTLSGNDEKLEDTITASDGLVEGSRSFSLIFTNVTLEPSQHVVKAAAGAKASVTIYAHLSYNNEYLSGLKVEWIQGNLIGESSVPFYIEMPSSPTNETFVLIDFIPCEPVNVSFIPKTVDLSLESISGAKQKGDEYWTQSGSTIVIKLRAKYVYCDDPLTTIFITDGKSTKNADENGYVEFSYSDTDKKLMLSFLAVDGEYALSKKVNTTLVFTRISLKVTPNATFFNGLWYACNNVSVGIRINATYAHNKISASNISVTYLSISTKTDENGVAVLNLSGLNEKYEGDIIASDGIVNGSGKLILVFTNVVLEPSDSVVEGFPEDDAFLVVRTRLTYNDEYLNGLKIRWVESDIVKESPANFILRVPEKGSINATFILEDFLTCCERLVVRVAAVNASLIANVNGTLRNGRYWIQSGSTATVKVRLHVSSLNVSASGMRIVDSYGNETLTDSNGIAMFNYHMSDKMVTINYTLFNNKGDPIGRMNITLVFSRIIVNISEVKNSIFFADTYYVNNGGTAKITVRTIYSHDGSLVSGARVSFSTKYSETNSSGSAIISLSDSDKEYNGPIKVSDGIVNGEVPLRIVFTNVRLEPSSQVLAGEPGEKVSVIIKARLSYNNGTLEGLKVRWVEENITKGTPANFTLTISDLPFNATFVLDGFLPCKPLIILVVPGVEFSVVEVKGAVKRGNEYWAQSNSIITLVINVHYKGGIPAIGVLVNDTYGNEITVPESGNIALYYRGSDEVLNLNYAAKKNNKRLIGGLNITLVFTRIVVETISVGGVLADGKYWANSYSTVKVTVKTSYSHSGEPAKSAVVDLLGYSAITGKDGVAVIDVTGVDREYVGYLVANDGAIMGEGARLAFLFTRMILNATREGNAIKVKASWAHNSMPVENLKTRIFQTDQVGITDSKGEAQFIVKGIGVDLLIYALDNPNGIYAREVIISL
ncbi:MAG: hypothetical protein QXD69_00160 [Candidatus Bathyarchaeia archaeon]